MKLQDSLMEKIDLSDAVLKHLRHAILVVNSELEIVLCNESASTLWRTHAKNLEGRSLNELFIKTPLLISKVNQSFEHKNSFQLSDYDLHDYRFKNKHIDVLIDPVFDEQQSVVHVVMSFVDQTFIMESEAQREEEGRAYHLSEFVSVMTHELQNPLGGIKGVLQLLKRDQERAEISTEPVQMVLGELGRIDRLLKDLLLYSHPIKLKYKCFNLHALLDLILKFESNMSSKTLNFLRYYDPSLPEIQCDYDKLHQVLLNLIRNAVEVSPENGRIMIRTQYCRQWEIAALALDPNVVHYRIDIEDEGAGVKEEQQKKLFTPLFTTKTEGHGLGLSISKKIIDAHGGILRYAPASLGGAAFQIYLPQSP